MEKFLTVIAVIMTVFMACSKQASYQLAQEEMTYFEIAKEVGHENAFRLFDAAGKTEADPTARGNARRVKANATLSVEFSLTQDRFNAANGGDSIVIGNLPSDKTFGGVQSAVASTPTGGLDSASMSSTCNWYLAGQSVTQYPCVTSAPRPVVRRGWSGSVSNTVYFSPTETYN